MSDDLKFWVRPAKGAVYEVDLTEFAFGGALENVAPNARKFWAGDFSGRAPMAFEFAALWKVMQPDEVASVTDRSVLRAFFRFLDEADAEGHVSTTGDLTEFHGSQLFSRWSTKSSTYQKVKTLLDRTRALSGLKPLVWPARPRNLLAQTQTVDQVSIKRLYTAVKREGMQIKAMFIEGARLAGHGRDPRGEKRTPGTAEWERRTNHAWLTRELTRETIPTKDEIYDLGGRGLNKANNIYTQMFNGPSYLVPSMTDRGSEGIVGKLRWFHPSYHDTAIFLLLFLIGSGWNVATAMGIDVTAPEHWYDDHPQKNEFKILHAFKGRSDRHQFVPSLAKPEWHPFQLVSYMVERTAPLRRTATLQLETARTNFLKTGDPNLEREIHRLEYVVSSPWLYTVVNKIGAVGAFENSDSQALNEIVRAIVKAQNLDEEHPDLLQLSTGQIRDAWIQSAYENTGHNILLTRLAAQHRDARTLRHYLSRRRYRAESERSVRAVQDAAFQHLIAGRILDPTRVRILVQNGVITAEQETRLLDWRQRTRVGMGCLDPQNPPKQVAPGHREGSLCRVQRCTGCSHGIVFEDSFGPLTKSRAQLIRIKGKMPLAAWVGSSFEDEEISMDETLKEFDPVKVEEAISAWLVKIDSGEVTLDDAYPAQ